VVIFVWEIQANEFVCLYFPFFINGMKSYFSGSFLLEVLNLFKWNEQFCKSFYRI